LFQKTTTRAFHKLLGGPAAVDGNGCAGDITRRVGGQENNDAFDFMHLAPAAHGDFRNERLIGGRIVEQRFVHFGSEGARADRIHRYAVFCEFERLCFREKNQPGFAGGVRRTRGKAHLAEHARHIYDAAPALFDHARSGRLGADKRASKIDVDNLLPIFERHVDSRFANVDACVVDQNVDAAEFAFGLRDDFANLLFVGDVRSESNGPHVVFLGDRFGGLLGFSGGAGTDNDVGGDAGQCIGHLQAETFAAAGDPGSFAVELEKFETHLGLQQIEYCANGCQPTKIAAVKPFDIVVVGGINSDFVLRGKALPAPGETVMCDTYFEGPGGKGANQAVAAARLGARVAIIGCVGKDKRGDAVLDNLRREKVDTSFVARHSKAPTGVALIIVDESGEKSIGACMGANHRLTPADVRRAKNALSSCRVLLMQFEAPDAALVAAAKMAKKSGAKVVLDPAPPRSVPTELLPLLDIIRPNSSEAEFLTGIKVTDRASAQQAADALMKQGPRAVALQAGHRGDLFVWDGGEEYLPHFKVKSIDATGAGDAFAAGLSVGLAEGKTLSEAGRIASATAALKTLKLGAQAGLPTRPQLDRFLRSHK